MLHEEENIKESGTPKIKL